MYGILLILHGEQKGDTIPITQGKNVIIGRGNDATFRIDDPHVSLCHCEIAFDGTAAILTDSASANGTWVNDQQVQKYELKAGDTLRVGSTQFSFQWTDGDEKTTQQWIPLLLKKGSIGEAGAADQ